MRVLNRTVCECRGSDVCDFMPATPAVHDQRRLIVGALRATIESMPLRRTLVLYEGVRRAGIRPFWRCAVSAQQRLRRRLFEGLEEENLELIRNQPRGTIRRQRQARLRRVRRRRKSAPGRWVAGGRRCRCPDPRSADRRTGGSTRRGRDAFSDVEARMCAAGVLDAARGRTGRDSRGSSETAHRTGGDSPRWSIQWSSMPGHGGKRQRGSPAQLRSLGERHHLGHRGSAQGVGSRTSSRSS